MNAPRTWPRLVFLALLYTYVSGLVLAFLLIRGMNTYAWATVPKLVDGTAYRPFVTRALLPTLVRGVVRATPALHARVDARIERLLANARPGQQFDRTLDTLGWTPGDVYVQLVAALVMFACLLVLPWVLRRLLTVFYDLPPPVADLVPVFGLLALPLFFVPYARYLYDPGTMVLWALGLLLVAQRRHLLVWLLLPVLAYHKETAVLLPSLVALREWGLAPKWRIGVVYVLQLGLVVVVRLWLGNEYAQNSGGTVLLVGPAHTRELVMMVFRKPPYVLAVVAMFWALVHGGWRVTPLFLRRALLLVLLPLVVLSFAFGFVDEIRGYYEAWPIVVLLAVPGSLAVLRASPARAKGFDA